MILIKRRYPTIMSKPEVGRIYRETASALKTGSYDEFSTALETLSRITLARYNEKIYYIHFLDICATSKQMPDREEKRRLLALKLEKIMHERRCL